MLRVRYYLGIGIALVFSSCAGAGPVERSRPAADRRAEDGWTLLFEESFSDDSYRDKWHLEGLAHLAIRSEGAARYLEIATKADEENPKKKQSVLWCKERFPGELRFVFRARGASGNRSIFYFNANPAQGSGRESIFDWVRPDADMIRYAGDDRIEMYSVGILRDDQAECNLRYIGGSTAGAYRAVKLNRGVKGREKVYGRETIIHPYDSPFSGRPDTWFEFDLRVAGGRIALKVDGKLMFDVEDPGDVGTGEYAWTPLADGGWFAFRNFRPNAVDIDYVRVYQRTGGAKYYIGVHGDDNHSGTKDRPWRTIARANRTLGPGDTVLVSGGEYKEPIRPERSGEPGRYITYKAQAGQRPVITDVKTAIDLTARAYIQIDGIHVDGKHLKYPFDPAKRPTVWRWVQMAEGAHHNIVRNCRFQFADSWDGFWIGKDCHHNQVLDNRMDGVGSWDKWNNSKGGQRPIGGRIPREKGGGNDGGHVMDVMGYSNLVQRNVMTRGGHGVFFVWGLKNVVRYNTFGNKWGESTEPGKRYGIGSKGNRVASPHFKPKMNEEGGLNLFEYNVVRESYPASDQPLNTSAMKVGGHNQIVRRNVMYDNNNKVIGCWAGQNLLEGRAYPTHHKIYHNVFFDNGGAAATLWSGSPAPASAGHAFKNNIVYSNRTSPPIPEHDVDLAILKSRDKVVGPPFSLIVVAGNSILRRTPGDARVRLVRDIVSLADVERKFPSHFFKNIELPPRFAVDRPRQLEDFRLCHGSPQVDRGVFLTRTLRAGSGNILPVEDAGYFCDGFDIVEGDLIQLEGQERTVRVTTVEYEHNMLVLDRPLEWEKGQGVSQPYSGSAPDIGAHECR